MLRFSLGLRSHARSWTVWQSTHHGQLSERDRIPLDRGPYDAPTSHITSFLGEARMNKRKTRHSKWLISPQFLPLSLTQGEEQLVLFFTFCFWMNTEEWTLCYCDANRNTGHTLTIVHAHGKSLKRIFQTLWQGHVTAWSNHADYKGTSSFL